MPRLFQKRLGFFCLLAFVACQSSGSQKPTPKMPPSEIKETKAVSVLPQPALKNCEDVFKKAAAESILTFYPETKTAKIEVNSNKIYDEESLGRWAMDLAKAVFTEPACTVDKISFVAMVSADVYYQGLLLRSDYDFFKREKISLAEWMRRLDIKELNTVASVKTKLKKARDEKEHDKALDLAKQWIDLEPNNETAKLVLANIYLDEASYFEAIMRYEDLIKIKADNALVLFNLAYAKTRIGSFSEAIALYEKVQTSDSDDVFWLNFAEANLSDHRLSEAEKALEPVKDKERLDCMILSANLKRARKDTAGAKELLDALVSRGDDKDLVFFNLVVLALDMKDEKAAQLAFVSLQTRNAKMAEELSFLSVFGSKQQTPDTMSSAVDDEKEESDVTVPEIEEAIDEGDGDEPLF